MAGNQSYKSIIYTSYPSIGHNHKTAEGGGGRGGGGGGGGSRYRGVEGVSSGTWVTN